MSKIIVTGGGGFVGTHLCNKLRELNHIILAPKSSKFDLTDPRRCDKLMTYMEKPDAVIHLAAKCGGIGANMNNPGKYFYENIMMGANVIESCRKFKVKKIILLGTVCSYPKYCSVPFKESDIWEGFPEETNAPYGIAKKALYVMLDAYNKQYGLNGTVLVPSNLYGPNDNFDDNSSHVIPALIKKIYKAKLKNKKKVEVWGDGTASREFLYVGDLVDAIIKSIYKRTDTFPINIGTGKEITIKELAHKIKKTLNYEGELYFNKSYPNGQPRRCIDSTLAKNVLNFTAKTTLDSGLSETVDWFNKYYIKSV
tara:strand:+ start:1987 stop:2919 length:933 start_codon:yes stop_codon:yes gene_type:complete